MLPYGRMKTISAEFGVLFSLALQTTLDRVTTANDPRGGAGFLITRVPHLIPPGEI
jgi:hypothetical protein